MTTSRPKYYFLLCALTTMAFVGCQHAESESNQTMTFRAYSQAFVSKRHSLDTFSRKGPFSYNLRADIPVQIDGEPVVWADLAVSSISDKAPLVIISHGNHSHKEAHRYQAERLASFGMHALAIQLPNNGRWLSNGRTIYKLVEAITNGTLALGPAIDRNSIILAGHSFGSSAISVAAGLGARVSGLIYLDPALVHDQVKSFLKKVKQPVMLLGADKSVFRSRQRSSFYTTPKGPAYEISIKGATHDDAQFPSMFALSTFGKDPFTTPEKQNTFASALTSAALSLAATKSLSFAWQSYNQNVVKGFMKTPRSRNLPDLSRRKTYVSTSH